MKNLYKLPAIIALIAVIGFAFTACEQPAETSTLTGITADYTGGSVAINTDVNSLKSNLTVTAKYSDNTSKILNAADYSLSGDLSSSGQKTVTVSYEGKTTTFNVTVTAAVNNDITYTAAQTGGADGTTDSAGIVFTFSASVDSLNLSAADITVSGAAEKDTEATLTGTGTSLTLAPITVNAAGLATVVIAKEGIEAVQKSVTIYKAGAYVPEYWNIIWHLNGGAEGTGAYPTQIEKGAVLDRPSPDPSKADNTFGGWYSDSGLAQPYTFANPVTTDLNLYAKWVVIGIAPTITTTTLPNGAVGTEYSHTLTATGEAPITWIKESGELPGGLDIDSDTGVISGTPTTAGTFNFTVTATNAAGSHQSTQLSITITPGGTSSDDAIPLIENIWADGNLPTSSSRQWFTFTATAATQYIHIAVGTLNNVYVQVYTSNGTTTVGSETRLYSSTTNTSRTLTSGQTYYIRVRPYVSTDSGTYRIGFNASTTPPPVQLPTNAITLTANTWADGNLPTSSDVQWFTFTATASTQYIHAAFSGTLDSFYGIYVQVYDNSGATVGSEADLSGSGSYARTSRTLAVGQTYYIRVWPYSSDDSGTYLIGFNTSTTPPPVQLPTNAITLIENQWADGSLPTSSSQQWFTFTATASTQWIHFAPGTLSSVYVQVYDSSGAEVGSETRLYSYTRYTSRSLTSEQTYYIRVKPYESSDSGTYRIGFNTSTISPPNAVQLPTNAITLTVNTWADGSLPTSTDVQWFTFTATASTQYIHIAVGTLTTMLLQVYNSSGATVGSESVFQSTTNTSRSLTTGQIYYIGVRPYSSGYSGAYRIGFTTSTTAPNRVQIPSNAIQLTENQWADGSLPTSSDVQWFSFTATASTQYIHVSFGTQADLYVQVYDSSGAASGSETSIWSGSSAPNTSRSLTSGQTYYIRVWPYNSTDTGTYRIGFTASTTAPPVQLPTNAIPLTENQWADGNIPTSNDVQWFVFTATATTQYIHFSTTGTLKSVYVQVYNSSGTAVGSQTNLYSSTTNTSRSLASEQTYYIRVRPYSSSYSGTYQIGFTTSTTAPILTSTPIPLTVNQWADGNLPTSSDVQWFTFTATASTQYIHVEFGTLTRLYVQVYDSNNATVGSETSVSSSYPNTSRSLTVGQTYYIKVRPYESTGTYRIGFNTSTISPPNAVQLPTNAIGLTANQWADGNIATAGDQQWFTFTATAATQYIHVTLGTLTVVNVQVYDSSGAAVGGQTNLYSSTRYTSRSLASGQTYYIRVWPIGVGNGSGTYRIGFNTSTTAPTS